MSHHDELRAAVLEQCDARRQLGAAQANVRQARRQLAAATQRVEALASGRDDQGVGKSKRRATKGVA